MNYDINTKMFGWEKNMETKKMRHAVAGGWTAVILNPIWLIVDYFSAPGYIDMIATVDLISTALILVLLLTRKHLKLSANFLGIIIISLLSIAAAYASNQLPMPQFSKLMMSYTAIFIGAGMLVLFELKHSIITVIITLAVNIVFYLLFSPLEPGEYMLNGGLLVLLVEIFMVISININYKHASRNLNSKLILESKQNELIQAKHEALKSKELQSQFLSNMSHEIRTPMNGVIGITRVLKETKLDKDQQHYLNAITRSSENLMIIINDILDFSKIEAGKIEIERTRFNLTESLDVVQELLISIAQEKGLYLITESDKDVPEWIEGDPVRLNQVLINLIGNAIKFTDKGGVTVKVNRLESPSEKVKLKFTIEDTGIGIPEEKQKGIFRSFSQASSSITRTHGGTGLGLTISKQLIEMQNGTLSVESELNKGSSFIFEIEYYPTHQEELEETKESDLNTLLELDHIKDSQILLVEDHPINQMLAIKVLEDWGFNVDLAENGLIALDKVGQKDYDLILMDINMPEMDGYTTTHEIRSGNYRIDKNVPIVAMTASAFIGENQKCFKAGMNDYIAKPFNPDLLLKTICKCITSSRAA